MVLPINGKFILAPMAGVTDPAFREQCLEFGAGLVVTELTSVEGIIRADNVKDYLRLADNERPAIQLFGSNIKSIIKAAKKVEPFASIIDFNLGCPAPHITAQEAGAALLMKPEKISKIFSSLVRAVSKPVTAKIRMGFSDKSIVFREVARVLEDAGVSMITLHPRTVKQGYSGTADWSAIKELVNIVSIPVCGNGDVDSPEKAVKMLKETGCDYVMIGRAARGNPFIFKQCNDYLEKGFYDEVTDEMKISAWNDYLERAVKYNISFSRMKVQAQNYSRGLSNARMIRDNISRAKNVDDLRKAFLKP